MSNSPVLELQALAGDPSSDIVSVLLKAKMIAIKLNLNDLSEWLEYEIDGYPTADGIPKYRVGRAIVKAFNPYHGWFPVDFSNVPTELIESVSEFRITESISSMNKPENNDGMVRITMPPKMVDFVFGSRNIPLEVCWFFSANKLKHIVTTVRNKVLTWSLELEKQGIMGDGLLFTQKEKDAAPMTITNNNTNNFHATVNNAGAIGAGNTGDINQQNSISVGDIASLENELKSHGLDDNDVAELKQLVEQSPKPVSKEEVEKGFGSWIGKMTGKAFTGALKVAGAAAPAVLTNALCHYFGIPV
ncbi:abortive phage resistance protein [Klebsiella michiganensis]|uniref:AbiTii domain-containing protein n=1 Tax=Klebsiella michiganensis TaxID=1134687 RepID=UPI001C8CEB3A|nr:abortive phage resistance protein [Klebsiella michiganensis]MBX8652241.1 abortive phage resistance protein [Klebsiella michiganensis]